MIIENAKMWHGVVEDRQDPMKLGRVRCRIFGIHTNDKQDIPTDMLPWSQVIMPVTSGGVSGIGQSPVGIQPGTWVVGYFRDKAMQEPVVMGCLQGKPESSDLIDAAELVESLLAKGVSYIKTKLSDFGVAASQLIGFNDPEGVYPKAEYVGQSDVNKLARGDSPDDTDQTVVARKEKSRTLYFPVANSLDGENVPDVRSEPPIPYSATYPHNKITESESGHVIEIDDTPGAERLHTYHRSGTYEEIQATGTKVVRVVGDNYSILLRHDSVSVGGTSSTTVAGAFKLNLLTTADVEIHGPAKIVVHGDVVQQIEGNWDVTCDGDKNEVIGGDYNLSVHGNFNDDVSGNRHERVSGKKKETTKANHRIYTAEDWSMDAKGRGDVQNNLFYGDSPAPTNQSSKNYGSHNDEPEHHDLGQFTYIDTYAQAFDEPELEFTAEALKEYVTQGIKNEYFTEESFNTPPPAAEAEYIPAPVPPVDPADLDDNGELSQKVVQECKAFLNMTSFPDNLRMSEHLTLRQMTHGAPGNDKGKYHNLRAQRGMSKGEIACNLKIAAEKIYEPIYKLYPTAIVTSGFRHGTGSSRHFRGEAIDIQFEDTSSHKVMFERAQVIAAALPTWDAFLIEFKNTGSTNPWLHISVVGNGKRNRGVVQTLWNGNWKKPVSSTSLLWLSDDGRTISSKTVKPRSAYL